MNKEKQIEEMANDVLNSSILSIEDATDVAKSLYNRGYRKASDVAREIFEEIEREIKNHGIAYAQRKITELKKKYTEGGV